MTKMNWPVIVAWGMACMQAGAQGTLDPVAAPAPAMKTLAQIEPRTPIADAGYSITQSGSYYLTTNIAAAAGQLGITIEADDVTLDLGGFTVSGAGDSSGSFGIYQGLTFRNARIFNGSVINWSQANSVGICVYGLGNQIENVCLATNDVGIFGGPDNHVRNCVAVGNNFGIRPGTGSSIIGCSVRQNRAGIIADAVSLVKDCVAVDNAGNGIWTGNDSVVGGCCASYNQEVGIYAGTGSTIHDCAANYNRDTGIRAYYGSKVVNCVAVRNQNQGFNVQDGSGLEKCSARYNNTNGIIVYANCRVTDCTVANNAFQGIVVAGDGCTIMNNVCNDNLSSGIFVQGKRNRVEANHATGNDFGIYFYDNGDLDRADNNMALRNSTAHNTTANIFPGVSNWVAHIDTTGAFAGANDNYSLP